MPQLLTRDHAGGIKLDGKIEGTKIPQSYMPKQESNILRWAGVGEPGSRIYKVSNANWTKNNKSKKMYNKIALMINKYAIQQQI